MSSLPCNNRGISLVEVVIAVFITTIGILALMTLQPSSWKAASRSDYLGRAAEILSKELETQQSFIMDSCDTVTTGTTTNTQYWASGQSAAVSGDAQYTVTDTITAISTNVYEVSVNVSWYNGTRSISGSIIVTPQGFFGC
jgi:Tfp pilus assembly protein PilV